MNGPFVSQLSRTIPIAIGCLDTWMLGFPTLQLALVDLQDTCRVTVTVMSFRRLRTVVSHPPLHALDLSYSRCL